jgi:hypothetical protein
MKNFAIAILLAVVALAGFIATRPSAFLIARTRTFAAPPEVVHAHVNDLHQWVEWSPWEKLDPGMTREYSGPVAGPGASYHWVGNDQVGEGRMTITDSKPPESVTIRLEFLKPYAATNTVEFGILPTGLGTEVTWSMIGHRDFVAKAMSLVMDVEKMVGGQFEQGLAALDTVTAAAPRPEPVAPPAEATPPGEAPAEAPPEAPADAPAEPPAAPPSAG